MLIRSQDKKALIDMNQLTIKILKDISMRIPAQSDQNHKYYIKTWGTGDSSDYTETLGAYSAEEKAIKVLDMIQAAYEKYEYEKVFKTGTTLLETFQMPDDSEVEV